MSCDFFVFKEFEVKQSKAAMKVGTDAVLLGAWCQFPSNGNILDIGTGTGIIAMMAAQRSCSVIDAVEIDEEACSEASGNFQNSKWGSRINLYPISFQKYILQTSKKYDVIVSNPPYFSNSIQASSESRTMARHTCNLTFEELADGIASLLKGEGSFAIILPFIESGNFNCIAKRYGLYPERITSVQTTSTKPAKRILMQFGLHKITPTEDTLIIENEDHSYSVKYRNLTKNFYLGF
jgi:tRNA1Val (adenine37-N6)-methyltransferase